MTTPQLVAASPWRDTDARTGLLQRAVSATGTVGGHRVEVTAEPLLREDDGRRWQAVRIGLPDAPALSAGLQVRLRDGHGEVEVRGVPGPAGTVRVLVPAVTRAREVDLLLPALGAEVVPVVLHPQRAWTVHLVHHSHYDLGYTDTQREVHHNQRAYLDSAVRLARQTADWPEDARFRWAVESLHAFRDYERHRTPRQVAALVEQVRAGQIELTALPFNLHTDVCSTDELHELLRDARRIAGQYGLSLPVAMQTDVPGQVAGLPDALAQAGVKYLSVAHNWAGRSVPHLVGGERLPRLFRWRSPAGRSVLVWMTDSPHGLAYMEGSMLGFAGSATDVDTYLPAYLAALAGRGYPYPAGVFGAHGEAHEREPYPWDVLHLRTQGRNGDNGPAVLTASRIVREWNETWSSPVLRVSRNEDFFVDAEKRIGEAVETVEGDWGDWWVEGVGSAAVPVAHGRGAQHALPAAQTVARLAEVAAGNPVAGERPAVDGIGRDLALWDEHTWGAGNSWLHSDSGFDAGEQQWHWKVAHSLRALQGAQELGETALAHLGEGFAPAPGALASWLVVNPSGASRTDSARVFVAESVIDPGTPFVLRDARSGAVVEHRIEEQANATHREAGRWALVSLHDVPGTGWVRLDAVPGTPRTPPVRRLRAREDGTVAIENEFLRVVVDPARSCITSLIDLGTGRELARQDSVSGFNGYVYDEYASAGGYNHLANKLWTSERLELLAARSQAHPGAVLEHVEVGDEQRLVHEFTAPGVQRLRVTLTLRRGEPRLLVEDRFDKPPTRTKESAYLAFPFAVPDPRVRFEVSGGVTGDGLPHVPGAPRHLRAVREWVTLTGSDGAGVVWATRDAPLVQHAAIALPYAPFPDSTAPREPGTLFSWVHNNVWDTNFPVEQGFAATFAFAIGVAAAGTVEATAITTADALARPLRPALLHGTGEPAPAEFSLARVEDDRVRVVAVTSVEDHPGDLLVRLQSYADEAVSTQLRCARPVARAWAATYLGHESTGPLPLTRGAAALTLAPFDVTAVRVRLAP